MGNPEVCEIVAIWLKENKYDGLYNSDMPCACELSDLIPCGEGMECCQAGYKKEFKDNKCGCGENCDWHIVAGKG